MKPVQALLQIERWIDSRELGERRLLSLVCVVLVGAVWFVALQRPVLDQINGVVTQTEQLQARTAIARGTFDQLNRSLQNSTVLVKRGQLDQLRDEITRLEEQLANRALRIISPEQMVQALRDLLDGQTGLQLDGLENLAVEPAFGGEAEAAATPADSSYKAPVVYRHRVRIALRGEYLAVLRYLAALEELPWQFQWDSFSIEMENYPVASVVMYLNTLSLGQNWIGT